MFMFYSLVSFPAFEVSFFVSSVRLLTITEILFSSPCKIFIANIHIFVRGFPFLKMTILGEYFVSLFATAWEVLELLEIIGPMSETW